MPLLQCAAAAAAAAVRECIILMRDTKLEIEKRAYNISMRMTLAAVVAPSFMRKKHVHIICIHILSVHEFGSFQDASKDVKNTSVART